MSLLCLPHAGGGPTAFHSWRRHLPDDVELLLAHLPGRESRLGEVAPAGVAEIVGHVAGPVGARRSVVVFGHSWGAVIGLELSRALGATVDRLVVSGAPAPHLPSVLPRISHLPRQEFIDQLARLGGFPVEVLRHTDLMDLLMPALRADMKLAESFTPARLPRLACPIAAFRGSDDPTTTVESIAEWASYTTGPCDVYDFPGDHFFPFSSGREVISRLVGILRESTAN